MKILIEKTTSAATAALEVNQLNKAEYPPAPKSLYLLGELSGTEKIEIQYFNGSDWVIVKEEGSEIVFDVNNNHRAIYGEFDGRIYKPVTTKPAGVAISHGRTD